jgi:hypothetical protein
VPCEWVVFSNEILGDDFKYHDYYDSINQKAKKNYIITSSDIVDFYNSNMQAPNIPIDLEKLFLQCPI